MRALFLSSLYASINVFFLFIVHFILFFKLEFVKEGKDKLAIDLVHVEGDGT